MRMAVIKAVVVAVALWTATSHARAEVRILASPAIGHDAPGIGIDTRRDGGMIDDGQGIDAAEDIDAGDQRVAGGVTPINNGTTFIEIDRRRLGPPRARTLARAALSRKLFSILSHAARIAWTSIGSNGSVGMLSFLGAFSADAGFFGIQSRSAQNLPNERRRASSLA